MKKIIFIAMFCIVILGAFAANASKATENNKPEFLVLLNNLYQDLNFDTKSLLNKIDFELREMEK